MTDESGHEEENKQPKNYPVFEKRFDIALDFENAKQRFMTRVRNNLDAYFPALGITPLRWEYVPLMRHVANRLGETFDERDGCHVGEGFYELLRYVEALYEALARDRDKEGEAQVLDLAVIELALQMSEIDLGIEWRDGHFWRSGAKLLDKDLVNEPLGWLADLKYETVLEPFQKGLRHYMEANKEAGKLSDAITDMYEALEALAKAVTGRNKDLSANRQLFISKLDLSQYYSKMLDDYIDYANEFRHGTQPGKVKTKPKPNEVEAFMYTTGLFIRLAIRQLAEK